MLAISIGLILSMLVARSSVNSKIAEVKASAGTTITISPAGVRGFAGSGNALTSTELATVADTDHIDSTIQSLNYQLSSSDTTLTPSLEMGNLKFGRDNESTTAATSSSDTTTSTTETTNFDTNRPVMTPRITVTGTTDINSVSTDGNNLNITSGESFNASSSDLVAIIGADLADKNSLSIGSTFTMLGSEIAVVGIFDTGNAFQDSGIIMPLATVQSLTDQEGSISSIAATVDSSDNVASTVTALETALGDTADITSQVEQAEASVSSLQSISNMALAGVIGSTIAGAVIILLAMIIVVRERRREIGVIKAIGGSNFKVVSQFVSEAMTLTIFGSIIGLGFGILACGPITSSLVSSSQSSTTSNIQVTPGLGGGPGQMMQRGFSQISQNFTQITGTLTPTTFILAVGIIVLISVIGSAMPVWFIARIRPAEVLRTE